MRRKLFFIVLALIVILVSVALLFRSWTTDPSHEPILSFSEAAKNTAVGTKPEILISKSQNQNSPAAPTASTENVQGEIFYLTGGNFEEYVMRCFQGVKCDFKENPFDLYRELKKSGNRRVIDLLISFLRSRLKEQAWANQYKDPLKKMIDDFYPIEERQFQEAAYYNYLGNLQKSLDLYLDLEKRSAADTSLRPAPKLNIANTFFDLGRFREALPYYEQARAEYISGQEQSASPGQNEMIRFLERRIAEIKFKLSM